MATIPGNIHSFLADSFEIDPSLGLASGKIGGCIYFFYLSRAENNPAYRKIAEKLLDDVFADIASVKTIDVKNGLGGIGLGISFLIRNGYVQGNVNRILREIDDRIFKNLSYRRYSVSLDLLSMIQLLFYLYVRLTEMEKGSEQEYLFRELTIQTLNALYDRLEPDFFDEPFGPDMDYKLPQLVFVLGKITDLNFYNDRINKIIEELSVKILATIPFLQVNRLYLWVCMRSMAGKTGIKGWDEHICLLRHKLDFEVLLNEELGDNDIYVCDGAAFILLLLWQAADDIPRFEEYRDRLIGKIISSGKMDLSAGVKYLNNNKGLFNGIAGVLLVLGKIIN